jgi:5-formyltetrahydrofolate cyclo-ligase
MPDPLRDEKRNLRRDMAERRRAVAPDEAAAAAQVAARTLLGSAPARTARRVGLYAALCDEIPTRPLFDAIVGSDREAWLPRIAGSRRLEFSPVSDWAALRPGHHGILEPLPEVSAGGLEIGDVVVVPGVAFDAAGNRLGRGGGYYDAAFPPGVAGPTLIGFGYEFQIVDAVPHDARDRRVDAVVTECAFRRCARSDR